MTNNFDIKFAQNLANFLENGPIKNLWSYKYDEAKLGKLIDEYTKKVAPTVEGIFKGGSNTPKVNINDINVKPEPAVKMPGLSFREKLANVKAGAKSALGKQSPGGMLGKAVPVVGGGIGIGNLLNKDNTLWDRGVGAAQALSGAASFAPIPIVKGAGIAGSYITPFLYGVDDLLGFGKKVPGGATSNTNVEVSVPSVPPANNTTPTAPAEGLEMLPELDALGDSDLIAKAMASAPVRGNTKLPVRPIQAPIGIQPSVANAMAPVPVSQATQQIEGIGNVVGNAINSRQSMGTSYDPSALLGLLDRYLAAGAPVNEAMVDAIQRYPERIADTQRQQRFWRGISNWSGDDSYNALANELTPLEQANQQLALRQNLMNQNRSDVQAVGNLMAGMDMANYVGMPPSVAMMGADATKEISKMPVAYMNLLGKQYTADQNLAGRMYTSDRTAETGKYTADRNLEGRQYASDNTYNANVYNATLDSLTQQYLMQGRIDLAMQVQQLKNTGDLNRTLIQQLPWMVDYDPLFSVYSNITGNNIMGPAAGLGIDGLPLTTEQNKQTREFLTKLRSRR